MSAQARITLAGPSLLTVKAAEDIEFLVKESEVLTGHAGRTFVIAGADWLTYRVHWHPIGLKVERLDVEGRVYTSSATGVQAFSPDGDLIGEIAAPGVANFTFGGPDNDVLFILGDTRIWQARLAVPGVRTA